MKKILLFALVLALLLLPVGCTDPGKDKSADTTSPTAENVVNPLEQAVTTNTDSNGGEQDPGDGNDPGGVELPIDHFGG